MLSVAPSLPLAEDCASKKKPIWRHSFPIKKRKALILPTGVRDRDRPQISPPIGWHLVQNPTSLTTQQQILKAYMQPPPSVRRCRTASKPRRATFNFNPLCGSASEYGSVGSCFRLVLSYFGCRDAVYLSVIISPGGNRADKELYSHCYPGKFDFL